MLLSLLPAKPTLQWLLNPIQLITRRNRRCKTLPITALSTYNKGCVCCETDSVCCLSLLFFVMVGEGFTTHMPYCAGRTHSTVHCNTMATAATALVTAAVAAVAAALQHQQRNINNTINYHLCMQTAVAVIANRIGIGNSSPASKPC